MTHAPVILYDRTLRKGSFQDYVRYSESAKLKYLERLDSFRIDYIEISPSDIAVENKKLGEKLANHTFKHAKPCAYGNLAHVGMDPQKDPHIKQLLELNTPAIQLWVNPHEPKRAQDQLLPRIEATAQYLKAQNKEILFCFSHFFDLYQHNTPQAEAILKAIADTKPQYIILSDTLGGSLPSTLRAIAKTLKSNFDNISFGIESYNDSGLANALALEAVELGFHVIQGTFNGLGERSGCTNLSTIIPNLAIKLNIPINCQKHIKELTNVSIFVDEITNSRHNTKAPYVGSSAFTEPTQSSDDEFESTFHHHIDPNLVGNHRHFIITNDPNESIIVKKAQELNLNLEPDTMALKYFVNELKDLKSRGFEYEAADASLRLLLNQKLLHQKSHFQAIGYRVIVGKSTLSEDFTAEATIKVKVGACTYHTVAEGNGPVSALDHALRKALKNDYPQINNIRLTDFKVGILDSTLACDSQIRVHIETSDGTHSWSTVGASDNIIEASWQALRDAFEYKLFLDEELAKKNKPKNN